MAGARVTRTVGSEYTLSLTLTAVSAICACAAHKVIGHDAALECGANARVRVATAVLRNVVPRPVFIECSGVAHNAQIEHP